MKRVLLIEINRDVHNTTWDDYRSATNIENKTETIQTDEPSRKMVSSSENSNASNDFLNKPGINDMMVLTENRNVNRYKKKQIIYSEGNRPQQVFYIKEGIVKTYKCNGAGKELITGIYGPGDFLGYVALLEKAVYKDTAVAVEFASLAIIPKDEFEQMIETNLQIARKFMALLAENVTEKEQLLVGLAYNSLRKKVAEALLFLNRKYKRSITISRDNLAALAGTATESLIRTLAEFRQEKLIDMSDGMITIVNEVKLKAMVN
jgi:CRP-like cAMP-binding protein